jgi:actin-like ATPase involved in cell morphogenesis
MNDKPKTIEEERQEILDSMKKIIHELIDNCNKIIEKCSGSEPLEDSDVQLNKKEEENNGVEKRG